MKQKFSRQNAVFIFVLTVLGLLAAALAVGRDAAQSMPPVQPTLPAADPQVSKLELLLQRTDLSEETRQDLDEKRMMAERMALESIDPDPRPVEERGPKVAPALAEPLALEPAQPLWEGRFEGSEGMVRPGTARINNGWQGTSGGAAYQVFAGSTPLDPPRGLLLVAQLNEDLPTAQREVYLAPEGTLSLKIVALRDNLLLLETDTNHRLYFDLVTRQFQPVE